jgi:hypothetical protein
MVQIRTLKPTVRLRMPTDSQAKYRHTQTKVVRRTQENFPSPTPQPTPCRLWQGAAGSDGYGWRKTGEGPGRKGVSMHRWVMSEFMGRKLRPTEVVLHACDNPFCYRLDHLSLGTIADNNADMKAKGRNSPPPVNVFHGECHPMAKLTEAQVRAIRGHRQSGLYVKTIAEMFEVAPSTIRRICQGVTWNYVGNAPPPGINVDRPVKPPTRDLMAEAKARIEAEAERSARPPEGLPPPGGRAERNMRVKPIQPIKPLTRRNNANHP